MKYEVVKESTTTLKLSDDEKEMLIGTLEEWLESHPVGHLYPGPNDRRAFIKELFETL